MFRSTSATPIIEEGGKFEEEQDGFFYYSEASIRIIVCKLTWMASSTCTFGGLAFCVFFLLFQITPACRMTIDGLRNGPMGEWGLLQLSILLGSELGLLAMLAFMSFLVPTLIMTWITALVFQYLFGSGMLGRRKGLVHEGSLIAKDILWMAFKSILKKGNGAAIVVVIGIAVASGLRREDTCKAI